MQMGRPGGGFMAGSNRVASACDFDDLLDYNLASEEPGYT